MITREEYKKYVDDRFVFLAISETYSLIDKIFDELEQRITELEVQLADANSYFDGIHTELEAPKTCEGCKYEFEYMYLADRTDICTMCSRDSELKDYYKPKES